MKNNVKDTKTRPIMVNKRLSIWDMEDKNWIIRNYFSINKCIGFYVLQCIRTNRYLFICDIDCGTDNVISPDAFFWYIKTDLATCMRLFSRCFRDYEDK